MAFAWDRLKIGAGGQISGIDLHTDGTFVIRADTYGSYCWDPLAITPQGNAGGTGAWRQLVTDSSISGLLPAPPYSTAWGVHEIRIAPSNSSRFYMTLGVSVYTTANKGVNWTQTSFTAFPSGFNSNLNSKFFGPYLGADPSNDQICYVGTPFNGVWKTSNAGGAWTQVSTSQVPFGLPLTTATTSTTSNTIGTGSKTFTVASAGNFFNGQTITIWQTSNPANQMVGTIGTISGTTVPVTVTATCGSGAGITDWTFGPNAFSGNDAYWGGSLIGFDTSSTIYITAYGVGVYQSTNSGTSFSAIASPPSTTCSKIIVKAGVLYMAGDGTNNIYSWNGSAWATKNIGAPADGASITAFAFDPANASHVVAVTVYGDMNSSSSGVSGTWSGWNTQGVLSLAASDVPWLQQATPLQNGMTISNIAFDPSQSNVLYLGAGVGVFKTSNTTIATSTTPVTYTSQSVGIEQLVSTWCVSPPGGNLAMTFFDRSVMVPTTTAYPSFYGPFVTQGGLAEGFSVDYASTSPSTLVTLLTNAGLTSSNTTAYSTNGGGNGNPSNWTRNATALPGNPGGCIAASTPTNWVATTQGGGIFNTTNQGVTWNNPTIITGGTAITNTDSGWYSFGQYILIQNVCADRVTSGTFYAFNFGATSPGMYVSTDGGATFTRKSTLTFSGMGANFQMRSIPGQAGNFYSTVGASGSVSGFENNTSFDEWNWNGTTLSHTTISNILSVWSFGPGKAKPGNSYPTLYAYGMVGGGWGAGGVPGIYQTDDHCASWQLLAPRVVNGWAGQPGTVSGDNNTYGNCLVGYNDGGGFSLFSDQTTPPTGPAPITFGMASSEW